MDLAAPLRFCFDGRALAVMLFDEALSCVASIRSIGLCKARERSLLDVVVRISWNNSVLASPGIWSEAEWVVLLHLWVSNYHIVRWRSAERVHWEVLRGHDCSSESC